MQLMYNITFFKKKPCPSYRAVSLFLAPTSESDT